MPLVLVVAVEESYDGPALENGAVTTKFMAELLECFREQKLLHKKYAFSVRRNNS